MSSYTRATVLSLERWNGAVAAANLSLQDGEEGRAIVLEAVTGPVEAGDDVIINTTAIRLGLGSGGFHFVLWNLTRDELQVPSEGHIVKLRYTPIQANFQVMEEALGAIGLSELPNILNGLPVAAGTLHSQLLPVAVGFREAFPGGSLVYIMTDGGALPAAFSKTVSFMREEGLIDSVITCGHSFGGDHESVTFFGALVAARRLLNADAVVVLMGPGIVGTGSVVGHTGLEQVSVLSAAAAMGGLPIAIPRITFADERGRHDGISHHTAAALTLLRSTPVYLPLPRISEARSKIINRQLRENGIDCIHDVREIVADTALSALRACAFTPTVMGRGIGEEPEFFLGGCAAGLLAGELAGGDGP